MRKINNTIYSLILAVATLSSVFTSCNKYLDIAPDDGLATLDMVFNMRSQAIKYLASCYSYLPAEGSMNAEGMFGGDELVTPMVSSSEFSNRSWPDSNCEPSYIARGLQNVTSTYCNNWSSMYQAMRYCNSLMENVEMVPDMEEWEKKQWIAEAKVLKAYYLFTLTRKWGPVPIIRENLPVNTSVADAKVYRDNIDDCFDYMLSLIDEALPDLELIEAGDDELGRINKVVASAMKAKIAVTAASPLFNNNSDQSSLVDSRGVQLFPAKSADQVQKRWDDAVKACADAIGFAHEAGKELYRYDGTFRNADSHIVQELTIREAICDSWNREFIWGNSHEYGATYHFHRLMCTNLDAATYPSYVQLWGASGNAAVTKNIADLFYTKHGIPVENDPERCNVSETNIRAVKATDAEQWNMVAGYETAECYFDREPRFYADLGFDGSLWFGRSNIPVKVEDIYRVTRLLSNSGTYTGYLCKKLVKHDLRQTSGTAWSATTWTFPNIRLADLYLLYAEAINEAEGPEGPHMDDLFTYLDAVRERAGIPGVKEAWDSYSDSPGKYSTQVGMREIIQRERAIELAFEGQRFWDLRRWKEATNYLNVPITGWNTANMGKRDKYYVLTEIQSRSFSQKDYFWPIQTSIIENNPCLVQNLGW